MLAVCCMPLAHASHPVEDDVPVMISIPLTPMVEQNLIPPTPSKRSYWRKTIPFVLSGSAAVSEIVLQSVNPPLNPVIFTATLLWFGANVAGLINIYLDYRKV